MSKYIEDINKKSAEIYKMAQNMNDHIRTDLESMERYNFRGLKILLQKNRQKTDHCEEKRTAIKTNS